MKFTTTEIILGILTATLTINILLGSGKTSKTTPATTLFLQEDIQRVAAGGDKVVVLFSSGAFYKADKSGQEIYFRDKVLLRSIEAKLERRGYTFVSVNTPCLANGSRCLEDFNRLALGIVNLNPEAVIYKGIDSGLGTSAFSNIMNEHNIPIYTLGTEVVLDSKVYVGPDNVGLGVEAFKGIEPLIEPGQSAIYVETVRLSNGDPLENGFPRINSARNLMSAAGIETKATIFTNWSKSQTYSELLRVLDKPVDYIIVPSTETAEGAVQALTTLGHTDTKIIALDFTLKISELLKEGSIYGAVPQNFLEQADQIVNSIEKDVVTGKKLFVGEFITKEKLESVDIDTLW